jgi:hypothetical protein
MSLVTEIFKENLPNKLKYTPSGWTSFNAVCCHNRGHKRDDRQRGGVIFSDGFVYNCFNCGYVASWKPGRGITQKLKTLMKWLGASDDDINRMVFDAMRTKASGVEGESGQPEYKKFEKKELPEGSLMISDWLAADLDDAALENQLSDLVQYVIKRGFDPLSKTFYWSPTDGFLDRVIIPFTFKGETVGWTARKIKEGKPKYLSDQNPNYVFNLDAVTHEQNYVFVCEGPFDALAVNGVALLHNDISDQQAQLINKLGKTVIVIPDRDAAGMAVINRAIELDWAVAFPTWDDDVKDAAAAVEKYGSLFVSIDAISTSVAGTIKINLYKKKLEKTWKNHSR